MKLGRLVDIKKAAGARWAFMQRYVIPCPDGRPYLERLRLIQTPLGGVYLHALHQADEEVLHDHPWSFVSVVLRGHYDEVLVADPENNSVRLRAVVNSGLQIPVRHDRFRPFFRRSTDAHYISRIAPGTVTLIFTGPRRREWGFWLPNGWVHHDQRERGAKP